MRTRGLPATMNPIKIKEKWDLAHSQVQVQPHQEEEEMTNLCKKGSTIASAVFENIEVLLGLTKTQVEEIVDFRIVGKNFGDFND